MSRARRRHFSTPFRTSGQRASRSTSTRPWSITSTMSTGEACASDSRTRCIWRSIRRQSRPASSANRPIPGSSSTTRTSTSERASSLPMAVEPDNTASLTLGSVRNAARSARNSSQWLRRYASSRNVIRNRRGLMRSPRTRSSDAARRNVRSGIESSAAVRLRDSIRPTVAAYGRLFKLVWPLSYDSMADHGASSES